MTFDTHSSVVRLPRLSPSEQTSAVLLDITRTAATKSEELLAHLPEVFPFTPNRPTHETRHPIAR
jgi:hypothetical protein